GIDLEEDFHDKLDCDNVMDLKGNFAVWDMLQTEMANGPSSFKCTGKKGRDGGVADHIGCKLYHVV
ncbi:MAG: hypothetical protein ACKPKO_30085, partial [Candidatus Fonsibacter sp.]